MARVFGLASLTALLVAAGTVYADVYSVDQQSVSAPPGDLLGPGPTLHVPAANLGLPPTAVQDLNAVSQGLDIVTENDIIFFSVDRASHGMPNSPVHVQWSMNQQAGDIYVTVSGRGVMSSPVGLHALELDEDGLDAPGLGLLPGNIDNVDAFSNEEFDYTGDRRQDLPVYFSLASGPHTADILVSGGDMVAVTPVGTFAVYKDRTKMGLQASDNIDALALNTLVGKAYFSLAPGSPTLAALGASPADIFYTTFNGTSAVRYPAGSLGLLPDDNVDALETNFVPEPASLVLLAAGAWCIGRRRRS